MRQRQFRYQPGQIVPGTGLRVVRPIGYGGMGAVYECEEVYTGNRYVLKVLHPELVAGKGMLARMEKEARTIAGLKHPNIVQIFWAGLTDETPKLFYYVMEKLEGYTLRKLYRKAIERHIELRIDSVLRIMARLLQGLAHAHSKGIIHRDIKPDNVFVHQGGIIKLFDFGIAVQIEAAQTTAGGFVGTVAYAAPEQFQGKQLTAAADLWAVGVMSYELLTCCAPFGTAPTEYALAQSILSTTPRRPMILREEIPRDLDDLIMRLLEKDPEKRPRDALQVAAEMEKIRGELIQQAPIQPDLTGPELMEAMGPPSITNVDQDLEEELPPPSEPARAQEPPLLNTASVSPNTAGGSGPGQRRLTDVLTPSAVERAIQGPGQRGPGGRSQASAGESQQAKSPEAAPTPRGSSGEPASQPSVPWANALRLLHGGTTVRRDPQPENLALSSRDAPTPALGVPQVTPGSGTEVANPALRGLRTEQHGTAALGSREPAAAVPAYAGTAPVRTVFEPFLAAKSPGVAQQPEALRRDHSNPDIASAGQVGAAEQPRPGHQRELDASPVAAQDAARQGRVAHSLSAIEAASTEPSVRARPLTTSAEKTASPPAKSAGTPRPVEQGIGRPPSQLIEWDSANPRPLVPEQHTPQSELRDPSSTLGIAANSLTAQLPAAPSRRVLMMFMGSLAGALIVFGSIAAVWTSHQSSSPAPAALESATAPERPLLGTLSPQNDPRDPAPAPSSEPAAPGLAASAAVPSPSLAVSAAPPVVMGMPTGVPGAAEPSPSAQETTAAGMIVPSAPSAGSGDRPLEVASTAPLPQPHSSVSRQRTKARPTAVETGKERKRYDDLPVHTATSEAASREEVIGLDFLWRPKPAQGAPAASSKPRPSPAPNRGAP